MESKILIIEDDIWIANSLKLYLENSWFEVETYNTGKNAVEKILSWIFQLIILDINLPEKNWIDICSTVRNTSNIPIIMLTARNSEIDKVKWLENWADDYISKPFSPRELLARINTIMRRFTNSNEQKINNENIINFWNIEINLDKFIVKNNWEIISFTKNEFDILKKIIEENWKMVERETLMRDIIWYDNYMFDRTIDTHIKNIRKKLWDKDVIITIRWKWYRLNK